MRISKKTLDKVAQLELWASSSTEDVAAPSDSPINTASLIEALQDVTADLSDVNAAATKAIAEVEKRLRELQRQPRLYYQCRAISWQILADRWLMLAAANTDDPALAQQLMDLAAQAESTGLRLASVAESKAAVKQSSIISSTAKRMALGL